MLPSSASIGNNFVTSQASLISTEFLKFAFPVQRNRYDRKKPKFGFDDLIDLKLVWVGVLTFGR